MPYKSSVDRSENRKLKRQARWMLLGYEAGERLIRCLSCDWVGPKTTQVGRRHRAGCKKRGIV